MKTFTTAKFIRPMTLGLLLLGLLTGFNLEATGQNLPIPPSGGAATGSATRGVLPSLELPGEAVSPPAPTSSATAEPVAIGDLQTEFGLFGSGEDFRIFDCQPALLESTGTWLRRGFWYSEVDVLMLDRLWDREGFILAFQTTGITANFPTTNTLHINGGNNGAEAVPRLNLGRFLFRDHHNRDHSLEFVAYGGGQWSQSGRLDAVGGGALAVGGYTSIPEVLNPGGVGLQFDNIILPLDNGNLSFDGATSMQYEYDSRFNNFELNYQVQSRMRKDRMEMEPSGEWVRRAQPTISKSLLAGIRYFNLSEDFDWDAFGIDADNNAATAPESGTYDVRTDNDLIGTQLGFGLGYDSVRWSFGLSTKAGLFLSHTDVNSQFEVTGGVTSGDNNITTDNLSFLTEGQLLAKWHLRPNFSLRAGFEIMYISSVALASEQLNFIPVATAESHLVNGDTAYMGGLFGFEGYW